MKPLQHSHSGAGPPPPPSARPMPPQTQTQAAHGGTEGERVTAPLLEITPAAAPLCIVSIPIQARFEPRHV